MIEVNNILLQGENEKVEFKTSFSKSVIETLVAFANTKGGVVYVGVKDNADVIGVDTEKESLQKWANEIKLKTVPSIIPDMDVISLNDKKIVTIRIQEYPVKPISVQGKFYKRISSSNHLMDATEISDLYLKSMQYSWDSYPYHGASFDDLNEEKIRQFIAKVNESGRFVLPNNEKEALVKLRLLRDDVPTNAAMILFSKEDLLYNVHIGRFKTPSTIIADNMISGNLYDVVEKSMQYIISHIKFAFEITGQTTQRTEIPEYPLEAIRELLLNAVIHRDYQSSTDIQIKIFDRSIQFFNPSGLYGDITVEDLKTDFYTASTRNKLIAEAFYLTKDIEKYGSGFVRVRKQIASYPTMKFDYRNDGYGFFAEFSYTKQKTLNDVTKDVTNVTNDVANVTKDVTNVTKDVTNVTNDVANVTKDVTNVAKDVTNVAKDFTSVPQGVVANAIDDVTNNRMLKILALIKENSQISTAEISKKLNVTKRTIIRDIEILKQQNILVRIGATRSGSWKILKND